MPRVMAKARRGERSGEMQRELESKREKESCRALQCLTSLPAHVATVTQVITEHPRHLLPERTTAQENERERDGGQRDKHRRVQLFTVSLMIITMTGSHNNNWGISYDL